MTNKIIKPKTLKPGDTIGILGGGQLGRMLGMAASKLGLRTIVLEPNVDCPAAQTCNRHIIAEYDEPTALGELVNTCAAVTYEFENIPASAVQYLEEHVALLPNSNALEKSQDRLTEKNFLNNIGIQTAPYYEVNSLEELQSVVMSQEFQQNMAGILKTRRLGYDGKGQARVHGSDSKAQLQEAWQTTGKVDCVLEGFVNFIREISVIAARDINGNVECFDPAENIHRDGILHTSTVPAKISDALVENAKSIAATILSELDYVGVMGVEFFVTGEGSLIVNEFAPRVHNSGHWTEAACTISQFEQHIRAVSGMPLGDPSRHSNCVMENLIGDDVDKLASLLGQPNIQIHLYGKSDAKKGRKMGHFTRIS